MNYISVGFLAIVVLLVVLIIRMSELSIRMVSFERFIETTVTEDELQDVLYNRYNYT